jgi:exosortase/archaeosortase family protein
VAPLNAARRVGVVLVGVAAALILLTPFVATLDDLLAALAQRFGLDALVAGVAAPEARVVAAALNLMGVHASSSGATLWVMGAHPVKLVIGWNCVGWQGLVIFGLTLVVGLRPHEHWEASVHILTIGLLGTIVVNLARIILVSVLAADAGYYPAIFVHDWAATLFMVVWLAGFWAFAQRWILDWRPATAA